MNIKNLEAFEEAERIAEKFSTEVEDRISQKTPRRAHLEIPAGYLQQLLQIPEEAMIDGIELDFCQPDLVLIRIIGAGWPTGEGQMVMSTTGVVMDGEIDWRLPQQEAEA